MGFSVWLALWVSLGAGQYVQRWALRRAAARVAAGRVDGVPELLLWVTLHASYEGGVVPLAALDALRRRPAGRGVLEADLLNACVALDVAGGRYAEAHEWRTRYPLVTARPAEWLALRINEAEGLANLGRLEVALAHPEAPDATAPTLRRFPLRAVGSQLLFGQLSWILATAVAVLAMLGGSGSIPVVAMLGVLVLSSLRQVFRWDQSVWATLGLAAHRAWLLAELGRVAEGRAALAAVRAPPAKLGRYEAEWHFSHFALAFAERDFRAAEGALAAAAGVAARESSKRNLEFLRGKLAWAQGRAAEAVAAFERGAASRYQHQGGPALLDWADALESLQRGDEARKVLERCVAQDPQSPAAQVARGRLSARAS